MIGTLIDGKYRILRELGAGAMGAVYQAEHTGTGRQVALKVIMGALAYRQDIIDRFWREARAAGRIDTQHITQVLDTGIDRDGNLPYLVMEMLSGEDFMGFLKRTGPIAPDLALRVIAQACIGLQKAHEASVVHRDIKPANLFLARRDAGERIVKILDFGIAKVVMEQAQETESAGLTKTGSMLGSPLYMSPEQALDSKCTDHRSDLWSLGIALYQALAGRTPFDHIMAIGQLVVEINFGRLAPVQELAPWVPPGVAAVVHRALQRNPNERFQSAAEMLEAIRPLLPYGWAITENLLVPLSEAERVRVEPRLLVQSSPSLPGMPIPTFLPQDQQVGQSGSYPALTAGAMVRSQATPPRASASSARVAMGAAILATVAVVVAGGYLFARRTANPGATEPQTEGALPRPIVAAPAAPAPSSAPRPELASAGPTQTAAPELVKRTVELTIIPAAASVEVDNKPALPNNGKVEIAGTPGSVHRVRISMGKYETESDVTVTEQGPQPPRVVLSFGGGSRTAPGGAASEASPSTPRSTPKTKFNQFE